MARGLMIAFYFIIIERILQKINSTQNNRLYFNTFKHCLKRSNTYKIPMGTPTSIKSEVVMKQIF